MSITHTHTGEVTRALPGTEVTQPVSNYCHRVVQDGSEPFAAPNYTAQPQQGRHARESFVRLIICLGPVNAVRSRYSGNCAAG